MITEMIFSDYYRTALLCILSVILAFFMRNTSPAKKVFALAGYEFIMLLPFLWIFIVCMIVTEFDAESITAIAKWCIKWILYFSTSILLQFITYSALWKKVRYHK